MGQTIGGDAVKGAATCPLTGADQTDPLDIDSLYRAERPSLVRYFTRNRASRDDAEDMAQEAFLRLAGANNAQPISKPIGYLRRIGRNLLIDRARSPEPRVMSEGIDVEQTISDSNELGRLEARDSLRRLEAAMLQLKPRTREVFLAHRLDGMSYAEIAEHTGLSVKRVEKIMSKAIAQLTRLLEPRG